MNWQLLNDTLPETSEKLKEILLQNRNIKDVDTFFNPVHPEDISPATAGIDSTQLNVAIARINHAKKNKETVVIFGDYDADGVCATAILWRALRDYGLVAQPFIPRRDTHGYGITKKALDEIVENTNPQLIITVDNGIVAHHALEYAKEIGIDVIVTDHHQPEKSAGTWIFPPAIAVVHTTQLCGSTVSWMLAREFSKKTTTEDLDIAAVATIADQVPLVDFNRSFAVHGLKSLSTTKKVGIKALAELSAVDLSAVTCGTVGYVLAPRINAMGRLAHGMDALRLLCTKSWESARKLARLLDTTNSDRQEMTVTQYNIAADQARLQIEESVLIVHSNEFHEGVIGLIAGRLVEEFGKPAVVLSINGEVAKGSARSIPTVNIVELLRLVREDLLEVGGHPMAAGLGVTEQNISVIKQKLFDLAKKAVTTDMLEPNIAIDAELAPQLLEIQTAEMIQTFDPFGSGNPEPVFAIHNAVVAGVQTIGKQAQHLKLLLKIGDKQIEGLAWGRGEDSTQLKANQVISAAVSLGINEWKNKKKLQMIIKDITN